MKKVLAARALAVVAACLTLGPLVWMLVTSAVSSVMAGRFLLDFLMVAELSQLAFAGALLSAVAARLSARHARWPLAAFAGMALSLAAAGAAANRNIAAVLASLTLYCAFYAFACALSFAVARSAFAGKNE